MVKLNQGSIAVYQKTYHVRAYEIDVNARLHPLAIFNYLQDAAGEHAYRLGVSISQIAERKLTWVISHYHVRIHRWPHYGAELTVRTWPSFRQGRKTYRDFELNDADGQQVATASTSWRLLSTDQLRPVALTDHLPDYPIEAHRVISTDFPPVAGLDQWSRELPFRVRMSDLDINRHVNNAVYVGWALESVREEHLKKAVPVEIIVQFRAPAGYGDRILSRSNGTQEGLNSRYQHSLIRESDGVEVARLNSLWQPINA